jgi:hypothetical protein
MQTVEQILEAAAHDHGLGGKLSQPPTPARLDQADAWVRGQGVDDPWQREYLVERLWLSPLTSRPLGERVPGLIGALGRRLLAATADQTPFGRDDGRLAALEALLAEIAAPAAPDVGAPPLQALLEGDLARQRADREAGALARGSVRRREDLVELGAAGSLYVLGDLHGDATVAIALCEALRERLAADPQSRAVFLGDYVQNGLRSIETFESVLALRAERPAQVVLLSGNHEFRETYTTAVREFFHLHWGPALNHPTDKRPPCHYGHLGLDLLRRYGVERAETLYDLYARWGYSLPYVALSRKGALISHSIASLERTFKLRFTKTDWDDLQALGYEAWKRAGRSIHARMVNSREIEPRSLAILRMVGNQVYLVGHIHYRAGDRDRPEGERLIAARPDEDALLATVSSSRPDSPDAGHYIAQQFDVAREVERDRGRTGSASACAAVFHEERVTAIAPHHLRPIEIDAGKVVVDLM